jgi:UDP-N-acetylmuramoyl-L-alanyl-D-glutamate--2,6-diaminopimelate ligase
MTLEELVRRAAGLNLRVVGSPAVQIGSVSHDSRRVDRGALFCCVRGAHVDSHELAPAAVDAGASALLVDHELALPVAQIVADDTRPAMAQLADSFFGHPSRSMTVVGVTGTNGKTTTTHLLGAIFTAAGFDASVLGTLSGTYTTPEAPELQQHLAELRDSGVDHVAMEVSSHALAMHRVDGMRFAVAVFTNLGRDHLDFHDNIERYFAAKARLFTPEFARAAVVAVDEPYGRLLADTVEIPVTRISMDDASGIEAGARSSRFVWRGRTVELPIGGRFNIANALAAATAAGLLGIDDDTVVRGLAAAPAVPGRFESVDAGQPFAVIVDFAHKPDALAAVLLAARQAADGRVIVVFGCGGDRDPSKRPLMGAAAVAGADVVIVTSDNPRSEDPAAIMAAIMSGIPSSMAASVQQEPDRRAAIAAALERAQAGDVVVIAGKGHETTQTFTDRVVPFDDREVVRELLESRP